MSYDFSRITERIYCGAHIGSDSVPVDNVAQIKAAGITHVIDCETDDESAFFALEGIELLSDPTDDDGKTKGADWFAPGLDFAAAALSHPKCKLLTHCAAGVNRGPSMAYAVLRALVGLDSDLALGLIRAGRPQAQVRYWSDADSALKELGWL